MSDLEAAFRAALSAHPQRHEVEIDGARRVYWFVDAATESGNPRLRGQLVLHEERLVREYNHDDPDEDDWRVQHPRNHWGFTMSNMVATVL